MFRTLALLAALALAAPAGAATVRLVTDARLVTPLGNGNYGVEVRGGVRGNGDWELGVGVRTSGNSGTFANGQVTWPALPTLLDYTLSWTAGRVQMTIGTTTVGWNAAWQVGNAVTVGLKSTPGQGEGITAFTIATLDGVAVTWSQTLSPGPMRSFTFWGRSLADGWTMTGKIGMTAEGRSRRGVTIAAANYAAPVPLPAAGWMLLASLGGLGLLARRRKAA